MTTFFWRTSQIGISSTMSASMTCISRNGPPCKWELTYIEWSQYRHPFYIWITEVKGKPPYTRLRESTPRRHLVYSGQSPFPPACSSGQVRSTNGWLGAVAQSLGESLSSFTCYKRWERRDTLGSHLDSAVRTTPSSFYSLGEES